jgi:cell division protein FtsB
VRNQNLTSRQDSGSRQDLTSRQDFASRRDLASRQSAQSAYYSHDAVARRVEVEEYFPEPVRRVQHRRVRYKNRLLNDVQEFLREHILSYLILLAFFGGAAGVLAFNAQLGYHVMQRESASAELATLQNSNAARRGEIFAGLVDILPMIEYYAINEFGMIRPEEFQIREVSAPRRSFAAP